MKIKSLTLFAISLLTAHAHWINGADTKKGTFDVLGDEKNTRDYNYQASRQSNSWKDEITKPKDQKAPYFVDSHSRGTTPKDSPGASQTGTPHELFSPAPSRRRTPEGATTSKQQQPSTSDKAAAALAALRLASEKFNLNPDQGDQSNSEKTPQPSATKPTDGNFALSNKDSDSTDNSAGKKDKNHESPSALTRLLEEAKRTSIIKIRI